MDNYKKRGFTLIELIIVITIITLFSGLTIAQFNSFSEKQKLKTEAQKFASMLELARKKTIAHNTIPSCVDNFNGYKVTFSPNSYSLSYCCAGDCTYSSIQSVNLPSAIQLVGSIDHIQFVPNFQGTDLTASKDIHLKNTVLGGANKCMKITVTTNGIVTIDETLISC